MWEPVTIRHADLSPQSYIIISLCLYREGGGREGAGGGESECVGEEGGDLWMISFFLSCSFFSLLYFPLRRLNISA